MATVQKGLGQVRSCFQLPSAEKHRDPGVPAGEIFQHRPLQNRIFQNHSHIFPLRSRRPGAQKQDTA